MSKLKSIVKQLSDKDYKAVYDTLMDSNAEKSASLLKYLKERVLSDSKIMVALDVNSNAYYTLRSRLNEKIEEYLVKEMESPKADILKKVANISEIVFTKNKTVVIATLRKLEKELIDFDLASELTMVYKNLKKLHINTSEHYHYSQLYNKHVAYTLALDKSEDILADYFKKYGHYTLTNEENCKLELSLIKNELINLSKLYQSHRLYVYQNCLSIFHAIFVEKNSLRVTEEESYDEVFEKIDSIFELYEVDPTYHHLKIVIEFLKSEYYYFTGQIKNGDKYHAEVNEFASLFMMNYSYYTFPSAFLVSKISRVNSKEQAEKLVEETKLIFSDFEPEVSDLPKFIFYNAYKAVCYFNADRYDLASKIINNMLNETTVKKYPTIHLEMKTMLGLIYAINKEEELFNQIMNSIQRQIRLIGKKKLEHVILITKSMKVSLSPFSKNKKLKIKNLLSKIDHKKSAFSPLIHVTNQDALLQKLIF